MNEYLYLEFQKEPVSKFEFLSMERMLQRKIFPPSKQIFLIAQHLKIGLDFLKISFLKYGGNVISFIYAVNYFSNCQL